MRTLVLLVGTLMVAASARAQQATQPQTGGELVDRVVAVVGDTVLLLSDVQTALREIEASGRPLPTDPVQRDALVDELIQNRVNDLVIIEAAKDAGIEVPDDQVSEEVDRNLREVVRRFPSELAFDAALATEGLTRARYRQILIDQARATRIRDEFLGQRMRSRARPLISEQQILAAFEERRSQLGQRPVRVSMTQVLVKPQASDSARARALRTAEQVLQELQGGADFEVLAKRFSDDPGTKEQGGDLGWFKPGRMVREFEQVVYALRPGQTSGIVPTEFGFHIIRLDRVRGAERKARHILIRPEITDADVARARERADSVATAVRGGANVLTLARAYQTPAQEMEVTRIPLDQLPEAYRRAIEGSSAGQVVGPIEVEGPGRPNFAVIKIAERQEAGAFTLDDVRERLKEGLEQQEMMEQLVEELRGKVYVQILM